ncbi:putative Homeobox protein 32 [Hibiscus syriacus]|uniref:Homeobox protein 32 n=1 Tax=Hibiscus syriacus TaxID=106335 RepID=A0A6A2Y753_HIBSY|nr:putative clathrin assembly protein At1g25240 [Hibiscus syriacus]KAE8668999.1 putative Homeobox protein 32 [Hibiscus syriacus]
MVMGLWNRITGVIKDKKSVVLANFPGKSSYRSAVLETAIINATSHDEGRIDKRSAQIVFSWIRASPISIRPLLWALSTRMDKTRSWVVAIKGLMLMHGVFHCNVPAVQKMGRLPFDLSSFSDEYSGPSRTWGFNAFIREYYAFLDQRATIWSEKDYRKGDQGSLMSQQLTRLDKWQSLLDMLLQVRPRAQNMKLGLILEAMDCIIIEIYDVYSRICTEITNVLLSVYSAEKSEAASALKILQKATVQGEQLSSFLEFCKEFGVLNASEIPMISQIPEEEVEELKRIINGASHMITVCKGHEDPAVVEYKEVKERFKTVITEEWVVFDENTKINEENNDKISSAQESAALIDHVPAYNHREIPDFICF